MNQTTESWKIDSIRVTNFFNGPIFFERMENWLAIATGVTADQTNKSKTSFNCKLIHEKMLFEISADLNRIDWAIRSSDDAVFSNIGNFSDFKEKFNIILNNIEHFDGWPIADRLAIGAVVTMPIESIPIGNQILSNLLPALNIDIENSTDILYRINRRTHSRVDNNILLNNLTTWQNTSIQKVRFQMAFAGGVMPSAPIQGQPLGDPALACQISFDFNTVPETLEGSDLETQRLVIEEMVDNIIYITNNGDVVPPASQDGE